MFFVIFIDEGLRSVCTHTHASLLWLYFNTSICNKYLSIYKEVIVAIKIIILLIMAWLSLFNDVYAKPTNFDKKTKCINLGELYYSNFLKEQEHNEMFSFITMDMSHEVAYSSQLDTCLIYIKIKFKDLPGRQGKNLNKYIVDLLSNRCLYFMAYGVHDNKEVVLTSASSCKTDKEFMDKKEELFK
jgi:hypothetical protein